MKLCGAGGKDGGGDDDAWNSDHFVHSVRREVAELLEIEAGLDENLYVWYGLQSRVCSGTCAIGKREEYCTGCLRSGGFELQTGHVEQP